MNISKNEVNESENNINNNNELSINNNIKTNILDSEEIYFSSLVQTEKNIEIKFFKVLSELNSKASNNILNYLQIKDLILLTEISSKIKSIIEKYYPIRLKIEYNDIKNFEAKNISMKNLFLKYYQIVLPHNNWFYSNINKSINTILNLSRNTISLILGIKKLPNIDEKIYAPLCFIFNYNSKHERIINNGWKKTADFIMKDSRFFIQISNLKIENLDYNNIKQAFIYLNNIENDIEKIKRFSPHLYELNLWCKAVVIYYILVHPYKLDDLTKNEIFKDNNQVYKFVIFIEEIINKFYLFKGFLEIKKLIKTKLGEYIFNIENIKNDEEKINNIMNRKKKRMKMINDNKLMGNILSYLNIDESILFINYNKSFYYSFLQSLDISCYNILKLIFIIKYNIFNDFFSPIPSIFENNIFSQYFFMLEDMLYPENKNISFLTKENINYIKNYKGENELINIICKIFCTLFNIKVEKAYNKDHFLVNLYIKSVILFCYKENSIIKIMRYFNIFNLNNRQIKVFYEELSNIYAIDIIKKVKNINIGFYSLLLWELLIFEYLKQFNPFLLMDKDTIINHNTNPLNKNQINIINDYIKNLGNLKNVLKIKYHFKNLYFGNNNCNNLTYIIKEVIQKMKGIQINNENIKYIIENYNKKQSNISKAYFHCKKILSNKYKNISYLYQKIMEELILINMEKNNYKKREGNSNNSIKNENYYINLFLSRNFLKYNNYFLKIDYNSALKSSKRNTIFYSNNKKDYNKYNLNGYYYRNHLNFNLNSPKEKHSLSHDNLSEKLIEKISLLSSNKSNFSYNVNSVTINNIQDEIIITKILFYLKISEFSKFSLINKRFYKIMKIHIYLRLFFLEKKKNQIEKKHSKMIYLIEEKRKNFYALNNLQFPNLNHSCLLLSSLYNKDISELRNLFKKYKFQYEIIISILCIFLNIRPNIYFDEKGEKIIDYFSPGKKLLFNKNVIDIIKRIELDNIKNDIIVQVDKILQSDIFLFIKENTDSPCLINLIKFEFGIMEYIKAIRKYFITSFEINNNILNKKEIDFCQKMDKCLNIYYKIKNYTFNKCQQYHSDSIKLLKQIDLGQNLGNEIKDVIHDIF